MTSSAASHCPACGVDIAARVAAAKGKRGRPPRYCRTCSEGGTLFRRGVVHALDLVGSSPAS